MSPDTRLQIKNRKQLFCLHSDANELSAERFYSKYWQEPEHSIPTEDPTTPMRLKLLFDTLARLEPVGTIMDAGCGNGLFARAMQEQGYEVVGMDISGNAVAQARRMYRDIEFVCNPLDAGWPFKDDGFSVVFCTEVIEHVLGIYEMLMEMNRVLKQGGTLILTTPYHGLIKNLLLVLCGFERHFSNIEGGHIRFFTGRFLKNLLNEFGFEIIETKYIGRVRPIAKSIFIAAIKTRNLRKDSAPLK